MVTWYDLSKREREPKALGKLTDSILSRTDTPRDPDKVSSYQFQVVLLSKIIISLHTTQKFWITSPAGLFHDDLQRVKSSKSNGNTSSNKIKAGGTIVDGLLSNIRSRTGG